MQQLERVSTGHWQVQINRPVEYSIITSDNLFALENTTLTKFGDGQRRFVVIDSEVERAFGEQIRQWFTHHGYHTHFEVLACGEDAKNLIVYQQLVNALNGFPIHRRDEPIIAIGGGVLTDIVAFVAATYRRGLPHIKIPTTLMGYIDAAIGIKNGVNFQGYKNRLGCFTAPETVLLDKSFLTTLPHRHLLNGMAEIIKLAIVTDAKLFAELEQQGVLAVKRHFVDAQDDSLLDQAINGMLQELAPNLYEDQLNRSVDFGHTFSYGLEVENADCLLHGEAVLLDILVSVEIAHQRALIDTSEHQRIWQLVENMGFELPAAVLDGRIMWESLLERIEHRNGLQRVPMPDGIGRCTFVNDIKREELEQAGQTAKQHLETYYVGATKR